MTEHLKYFRKPRTRYSRMLIGMSGWMDGGEVSTGTVHRVITQGNARVFAELASEDFYVYNVPGSMEVSAVCRPQVKIEGGLVQSFRTPLNLFFYDRKNRLVVFEGQEPNLRWTEYADCILDVAFAMKVQQLIFVGSFGGLVPHTREPRIYAAVSAPALKPRIQAMGLRLTDYDGPAGIATYLLDRANMARMEMISLVAEIPAYVQGRIPRCQASMLRLVSGMLGLPCELDDLKKDMAADEERLNAVIKQRPELAVQIGQLEENYDKEILDDEMGDLKSWLAHQGIKLS